jgi:hypothetical protein
MKKVQKLAYWIVTENGLNILCRKREGGDTIFTAENRIAQILHTLIFWSKRAESKNFIF